MLARESPSRALWLAVLFQVKQDIEGAKFNSVDYLQALSFLTAGGSWGEAREDLAVCLDMDPEFIRREGRKWIAARRCDEGLPPEAPPAPRPAAVSKPRPPAPTLRFPIAIFPKPARRRRVTGTPDPVAVAKAVANLQRSMAQVTRLPRYNPFDPFRHQGRAGG